MVLDDADASWYGGNLNDALGFAVASGGDTDGDGYDDVVTSSIAYDPGSVNSAGGAWLFYGSGI